MKRKVNPLIQALNEATARSRREGREMIEKAKRLQNQKMKIRGKYAEAFKTLDLSVHGLQMRASFYKPTIDIYLNKLESFKDPQLVGLLEYFSAQTDKISTRDWAVYLNRDYTFELDDVTVAISAYVKSDSPTCRKVQVGTKIEEVPQFEMICD
jgi:hypothetical protein